MSHGSLDWSTVGKLTNQAIKQVVCDHCSIPIHKSYWKNVIVFYNRSRRRSHGYLCVKCALLPTKKGKTKVTIDDLDNYIKRKISRIIKKTPI